MIGCISIMFVIFIANIFFGLKEWYDGHMEVSPVEYYVETIYINDNEYYEIIHDDRCSCYDPFFKDTRRKEDFIKSLHTGFCPICCDVDEVFDMWEVSTKNISKQDGIDLERIEIPEDCEWEPNFVYNSVSGKHRPTSIVYHR